MPADEFDKPEEVREIKLNRPGAFDMKERVVVPGVSSATNSNNTFTTTTTTNNTNGLSFTEKFQSSIFGQLYEHIKTWEDRSLRRSFIHVEDAGQKRAFFVKFVGEGVDDHGGPYRAVFQSAVGEEPMEVLDLFVPVPNAEENYGDNREKYIFNSNLYNNDNKAHYYVFLGKLLGIACRHKIAVPLSLPSLVWKPLVGEKVNISDLESIDRHSVTSINQLIVLLQQQLKQAQDINSRNDINNEAEDGSSVELLQQLLLDESSPMLSSVPSSLSLSVVVDHLLHHNVTSLSTTSTSSSDNNNMDVAHSVNSISSPSSSSSYPSSLLIEQISKIIYHLKLSKHQNGLAHLYRGLQSILPVELFHWFNSEEIENVFCGESTLNLDLLKSTTIYDGVSPDDM